MMTFLDNFTFSELTLGFLYFLNVLINGGADQHAGSSAN